jgi:hypothetical protein
MAKVRFVVANYTVRVRDAFGTPTVYVAHEPYYQPRPVPHGRLKKDNWKWDGDWRGGDDNQPSEVRFVLIHPVPTRRRLINFWR